MSRITDRTVSSLKTPKTGNYVHYDGEVTGFGARITAAGAVSFILEYRIFGRKRRYTIGRYPEMTATAARGEVSDLKTMIRHGKDPMEVRQSLREEPTFGELASEYINSPTHAMKAAMSIREDKRMVERVLRPTFGNHRLAAIQHRDVSKLHASLKGTPYQANRVVALLSSIFNYAIREKLITENPAKGVKKYREQTREVFLTVEQLEKFFAFLDTYKDQNAANALRLLTLTGSRCGETLKANWNELDLNRGVWTKPSHHTKEKKKEHVQLSAAVIELLRGMKPTHATGPVFPGKDGGHRFDLKRPWLQACKAMGTVEVSTVKGERKKLIKRYKPTVRIHDLRHSFASHLVSSGVSLQVVGKLLGHTQASTTMRYAHVLQDAQRSAVNQLATLIHFPVQKTA